MNDSESFTQPIYKKKKNISVKLLFNDMYCEERYSNKLN